MGTRSVRWRAAAAATAAVAMVGVSSPALAKGWHSPPGYSAPTVEVQTYNLYFGADLNPLFAVETPEDLLAATSAVYAEMQASNIPARVEAAAELIAEEAPELVGLQEVSLWRSAPATFTPDGGIAPTGPFTTEYDAEELMLKALADLGTPYDFVVENKNFSNETFPLPVLTATGLRLVTFTDFDVIVARSDAVASGDVTLGATQSDTFDATLQVPIGDQIVDVPRGWSAVDATIGGKTIRFANTHLEAFGVTPLKDEVRNPQARELARELKRSPHPVVLVGDINSRPTMCRWARIGTDNFFLDQNIKAYRTLQRSGLLEAWPAVNPFRPCSDESWTSGQGELDNAASALDHRIDLVFFSRGVSALDTEVVGDEEADRTAGGLWPSDHASSWAELRLNKHAWRW